MKCLLAVAVAHACRTRASGAEGFPTKALAADLSRFAVHPEPPLDLGKILLEMASAPSREAAFAMLPPSPPSFKTSTATWPIGTYVTRAVMWSLYCVIRTPNDYWATISNAIRVGGDTDTVAAMAGAVSGALNGEEAIVNCSHTSSGAIAIINRINDELAPPGTPTSAADLMELGSQLRTAIVQRGVAERRRRTLGGITLLAVSAAMTIAWSLRR